MGGWGARRSQLALPWTAGFQARAGAALLQLSQGTLCRAAGTHPWRRTCACMAAREQQGFLTSASRRHAWQGGGGLQRGRAARVVFLQGQTLAARAACRFRQPSEPGLPPLSRD